MFNNLKATLMRWCDLAWPARIEFKSWMKRSKSFNNFDVSNFDNPLLKVATATNESGEPVVYCPVQTCFLISSFVVNPSATPEEARAAGDLLDLEIARQAQRAGVQSLLICLPANHPSLKESDWSDFKEVRVFERKFPQTVGTGGIALSKPSQTARYLN